MRILLSFILAISLQASMISTTSMLVKKQEGFSKYLYIDSGGYSIGYGTNLTGGLSKVEANWLLQHRLKMAYIKLTNYSWFRIQNKTRKIALVDLTYNLGLPRLLKFKAFIWCLNNGYYHGAANALKHSLWYSQVGLRAKTIYNMIYKGK